jgi:hypothetical protein
VHGLAVPLAGSAVDPIDNIAVMFESLCQSVHKNLLAGQCPWCGCVILNGRAFDPGHWGLKVAQPELGDPRATDDLLAIIEPLGRDAKKAIPLLCAALRDADWSVRLAAANALERIGPDAKGSLPTLFMLLEDKDQLVRDAAEEAIRSIGK